MSRATWITHHMGGYTHDVAQDQGSAGGVHLHQVRRTRTGFWQTRILQSNGSHSAAGPVWPIAAAEGEALFATASQR